MVYRAPRVRCCKTATDEEIAEDPDAYECGRCERTAQLEALWPENAEAWRLYQTLCGRTVKQLDLHQWVLHEWFREERDWQPRALMLRRLDLIGAIIEQAHAGRETADG